MLDIQDVIKSSTIEEDIKELYLRHKNGEISLDEYYRLKGRLEDQSKILKQKKEGLKR